MRGEPITAAWAADVSAAARQAPNSRQVGLAGVGLQLLRAEVVQVFGDYLEVALLGGADGQTASSQTFAAARGWKTRNSVTARGTATYAYTDTDERTATVGAETEEQVLVPGFLPGDQVFVLGTVGNGTGVTDAAGAPVLWLVLSDGEAWAEVSA